MGWDLRLGGAPPRNGAAGPEGEEEAGQEACSVGRRGDRAHGRVHAGGQVELPAARARLPVEVATHIEGTAEADKKPGLPSRGMISNMVVRSAAREQAGTGGTVHDKEARTSAMHIDNFLEYFQYVHNALLESTPPIAASNPAFDENVDFSESIHMKDPSRVLVGDESACKIFLTEQAGFKIATFYHRRQAKAQCKAAAGTAVSHTTSTEVSFSDTYAACCNLAGDSLGPLWIQQKKLCRMRTRMPPRRPSLSMMRTCPARWAGWASTSTREAEKKEAKEAKEAAAAKKKMEAEEKRKKFPLVKRVTALAGSTCSSAAHCSC